MRTALFTFFLVLSSILLCKAQDKVSLNIGPYIAVKAGVNGNSVPMGRKNGVSFNGVPDFGIRGFLPFGTESKLGASFDLGYSGYSFVFKGVEVNKNVTERYGYLVFSPNFHFSYLTLGFVMGTPVSANYGPTIPTSQLNFMTEFTIGGNFPLMQDTSGILNLYIRAGYMLSGIYKDFMNDDPIKNEIPPTPPEILTNKFDPRAVSLSLGISYLFTL